MGISVTNKNFRLGRLHKFAKHQRNRRIFFAEKHFFRIFSQQITLNERFTQRAWDPRIDIAHYDWDPFKHSDYSLPLLSHLGNWRERMKELEKEIETDEIDVTFVADFPGLELENYLSPDLDNTTIELMGGEVSVRLDDQD